MRRVPFYAAMAALVVGITLALLTKNWWAATYAVLATGFFWTGDYAERQWKKSEKEVADMKQVLHAALRHADSPLAESQEPVVVPRPAPPRVAPINRARVPDPAVGEAGGGDEETEAPR